MVKRASLRPPARAATRTTVTDWTKRKIIELTLDGAAHMDIGGRRHWEDPDNAGVWIPDDLLEAVYRRQEYLCETDFFDRPDLRTEVVVVKTTTSRRECRAQPWTRR